RRTGGNPLFMAHVASRLEAAGLRASGNRVVVPDLEKVLGEIPGSLRRAIEKHLGRLGPDEQRALEGAAIAGIEFVAGDVAAGLCEDAEIVDGWCGALARRDQLLRSLGTCEWPDGTATGRYAFTHSLYLEVLQSRVTEGVQRRLHQRIGERLESAYGGRAPEIASSLSAHFARSGDHARAYRYHRHAGEQAVQRNAFHEAAAHLRSALQALGRSSDGGSHVLDELQVQISLGAALSQVAGFAAPDVGDVYARALALSEHIGDIAGRFVVVAGLEAFYSIRGDLPTAGGLARQLVELGEESGDRVFL